MSSTRFWIISPVDAQVLSLEVGPSDSLRLLSGRIGGCSALWLPWNWLLRPCPWCRAELAACKLETDPAARQSAPVRHPGPTPGPRRAHTAAPAAAQCLDVDRVRDPHPAAQRECRHRPRGRPAREERGSRPRIRSPSKNRGRPRPDRRSRPGVGLLRSCSRSPAGAAGQGPARRGVAQDDEDDDHQAGPCRADRRSL